MPSYLSPGVYIEEVPSGSAALSAGATAVAAFVGFTQKGPTDDPSDPDGLKPRLVTNWAQFEALYGGFTPGAMLPLSVYGYFNNGGSVAYIVRVLSTEPSPDPSVLMLGATDRALGEALEITSKEADPARKLGIVIEPGAESDDEDAPESFNLTVTESGVPVESYDGLTFTPGATNVETVVNAASERVQVATKLSSAEATILAAAALRTGSYPLVAPAPLPVPVKPKAFAGSETNRTGINGLVIAEEVTMV
ncbi:MAG: tail sheath protein, partial [Acidimicrobiales bacterium]|nr:tail sheath protein [Acidimicrobiales bacterium]